MEKEILTAAEVTATELATANKSNKSQVDAALADIAEKRNKEQTRRVGISLQKDAFEQKRDHLGYRFVDKQSDIEGNKLKALTAENDRFRAGNVDITEHEEKIGEIRKTAEKELCALRTEYDRLYETLKKEYYDGYQSSNFSRAPWNESRNY